MYIQIIKGYILGYARVVIEGYFIERLMNLCLKNKIVLWNSKRRKVTVIEINVGIKDFREFLKLAKKSKCKVKIKQKKGLPFIFNKYRKRKLFVIFLVIITLIIFSLSNFIWNIEVEGNAKIKREEIIQDLKGEGLSIGVLKGKVNTKEISSKLRLKRDDLAWIGIELKGTNAVVKIVEADKKPEIINEEDFCNIIATKPRNYNKNKCYKWHSPSKRGRFCK